MYDEHSRGLVVCTSCQGLGKRACDIRTRQLGHETQTLKVRRLTAARLETRIKECKVKASLRGQEPR